MARYTGPSCKLCRREGLKLFIKGDRCYTDKCSFDRRPYPPGQHGQRRIKFTEYGIRLREKQKVRRIYGMVEKQFRSYFEKADRGRTVTGEAFLGLLERRLDSVAYRLGFAWTRADGRQLVRHKHLLVNGKTVNIPSYRVTPGDQVEVRDGAKKQLRIQQALSVAAQVGFPEWMEVDEKGMKGKFRVPPERDQILPDINETLVVELYSK